MGWGRLRGFKRLLYLQYCISASCLWIKTSVLSGYSSAMPANLRVAILQDMMETDYRPAELSDEKYFREKRFILSHISEREGGGERSWFILAGKVRESTQGRKPGYRVQARTREAGKTLKICFCQAGHISHRFHSFL